MIYVYFYCIARAFLYAAFSVRYKTCCNKIDFLLVAAAEKASRPFLPKLRYFDFSCLCCIIYCTAKRRKTVAGKRRVCCA